MTREENVRAIIECNFSQTDADIRELAIKRIIESLQFESCEDAVSRKEVLDVLANHWLNGMVANRIVEELEELIEKLPSVTPTRKKGKWIMTGDYYTGAYGSIDYVKCSCCGEDSLEEGSYCPNCGAKMVEQQKSEG